MLVGRSQPGRVAEGETVADGENRDRWAVRESAGPDEKRGGAGIADPAFTSE
jgi:hypothetical protein